MTEVQIQGVAMSKDGLQAHYVASDPRASYTLVNAKVELEKYNPAFTEWVSGHKVDYNLMPPEGLEQHYSKSVVKNQGLPMSFLQVQSVEEGTEWYKKNTRYQSRHHIHRKFILRMSKRCSQYTLCQQ